MRSADPFSVSLEGQDMLHMPNARLLLIKICCKSITWQNWKVLIHVASRRYTLSTVRCCECCCIMFHEVAIRHAQEWWLTSWLVAQCADVLVTTRLAMSC